MTFTDDTGTGDQQVPDLEPRTVETQYKVGIAYNVIYLIADFGGGAISLNFPGPTGARAIARALDGAADMMEARDPNQLTLITNDRDERN